MDYQKSLALRGPPARALDLVVAALTTIGFKTDERGDARVRLTSPGMRSTRQNPLLVVSELVAEVRGDRLALDAKLGGLAQIEQVMHVIPYLSGVVLATALSIAFWFAYQALWAIGLGIAVGAVEIAIFRLVFPKVFANLRTKAIAALDALADQAAASGTRATSA